MLNKLTKTNEKDFKTELDKLEEIYIESFWGVAKIRLSKFRGMRKETFYFHLKETEWRFNHRHENIYLLLLKELRSQPL